MPGEQYISDEEVQALIPESLRKHFAIQGLRIPVELRQYLESVTLSLKCIEGKLDFDQLPTIGIVLNNGKHFELSCVPMILEARLRPATMHAQFKNMCLIDVAQLTTCKKALQVCCILEEIVHAAMHVSDEDLVGQIVCLLYPHAVYSGYFELKGGFKNL